MGFIDQLIKDTRAHDCVECGKCTSVCPVATLNPDFAPRLIVVKALEGVEANIREERDIWSCLTCALCSDMCPYKVDYCEFVRGMRTEAVFQGADPHCSQGGLIQAVARIQSHPGLKQQRLKWVTADLKTADRGDVYYFTGCLPHLDVIFSDRNLGLTDVVRTTVRAMNAAGVTPALGAGEVCCGHDLNWTGDEEHFEKLVDINLKTIQASGAKTVVFSCPECLRTFDVDYRAIAGDLGFEVRHVSDYLLELVKQGKLSPVSGNGVKVTYQDSCRLGRHLGIYDPPRELLRALGAEVVEMPRTREKAACCGVSAFATCDAASKKMQVDRMVEAKGTGAQALVTSCPKCLIHLNCAVANEVPVERSLVDIPIKDLAQVVGELLGFKQTSVVT